MRTNHVHRRATRLMHGAVLVIKQFKHHEIPANMQLYDWLHREFELDNNPAE